MLLYKKCDNTSKVLFVKQDNNWVRYNTTIPDDSFTRVVFN